MKEKDFDYGRNAKAQDNEFFSFSDEINQSEDYSYVFQNDSIEYAKEENPKSEEVNNAGDNIAAINSPKPVVAPKVSTVSILIVTAATTGGTILGGVTIATSPYINVSLFQSTSTSLVFEVETANIVETDELVATLSNGDYEFTYSIIESSFVSFEELNENEEYTLNVTLNGESKFSKKYITTGAFSDVFLEIMEYRSDYLSFIVYNESGYSFITTTVYNATTKYLINDQTEPKHEYVVTNFDPTKQVFISVKNGNNGLAFMDLSPIGEPLEELSLSLLKDSSDIGYNYASFILETNREFNSGEIEILLNERELYNYYLELDLNNRYLLSIPDLSPETNYSLVIRDTSSSRELVNYNFVTPKEPLDELELTELSSDHDIAITEATLYFSSNRTVIDDEYIIYLDGIEYTSSTLVELSTNEYALSLTDLTPNTSYTLLIKNRENNSEIVEVVFATKDVMLELTPLTDMNDIGFNETSLHFSSNREIKDGEVSLLLNESSYTDSSLMENGTNEYMITLGSLTEKTEYTFVVVDNETNTRIVEFTFITEEEPFEIAEADTLHEITYESAKIYFVTNKEITEELSLSIELNGSPYNGTFIQDGDNQYYLEFTNLPDETEFNVKVLDSDSNILCEVIFETLTKPFGTVTVFDETNLQIELTSEAYSTYQGKSIRVLDQYENNIFQVGIEEQIVYISSTFFKGEEYIVQIIEEIPGDSTMVNILKSMSVVSENGYTRPVFTAEDKTLGEIRVTYDSGYVPSVLTGDGNISVDLYRTDNVIGGYGYGTIDPSSEYPTDLYISVYLSVWIYEGDDSAPGIETVDYSGEYYMVVKDLNTQVLLYKTIVNI